MQFDMGQIVITRACLEMCATKEINLFELIARHARCDFGDLDEHDQKMNQLALAEGTRIFSSYETEHGKIWIITEAVGPNGRRASTCCLLPEDY